MPQADTYNYNDPNDLTQREAAKQEFKARKELYDRNCKQYDGNHKKPLLREGRIDDNVILNWNKQHVDATIAFLMPHMPAIELDTMDTTEEEGFVKDAWQANGDASLLYAFGMMGAKSGHNFCIMTEDTPYSRVIPIDPQNIIMWTNKDDATQVEWYEQQWGELSDYNDQRAWRKDTVPIRDSDGAVVRWEEYTFKYDGGKWKLDNEYRWNYPLSPIVAAPHFKVPGQVYGQAELTDDLVMLNDAGNKVASEINRILRFHAFPRTLLFGAKLADSDSRIANFYDGFPKDARAENLEMQSDLSASRAHLQDLKNNYFRQARVVTPPGDVEAFRGVTILGIMATYMPMITKNEILRRQYTQLIRGITRRMLMLSDRNYAVEPIVAWGSALPVDEAQQLDIIERMVALGMSKQTAFERLGLDWEKEQMQVADENLTADIFTNGVPVGVSG